MAVLNCVWLVWHTYISYSLTDWSIDPSITYSTRRLRGIFLQKSNSINTFLLTIYLTILVVLISSCLSLPFLLHLSSSLTYTHIVYSAHFSIFQWQKTGLCKVLYVVLSNALFTLDILLSYNSWGDPMTRITSTFLTQLKGTIDRYSSKTVVLWKQNNWERRSKLIKAVLKWYRFYWITNKRWPIDL